MNRAQKLSSTAAQNELMFESLDSNGVPIDAFSRVPTFAPVAASFNALLGAAEATVYSTSGITADDSPYKIVQWAEQALAFTPPDPGNARIDLIVATPATVQADVSTRNILLDPATRAFSPAPVAKTVKPQVTPIVVVGVAGASPSPPATPAGSFVLAEIWIPASAPDATTFKFLPRLPRKASYPFSGLQPNAPVCGILRGADPIWTGASVEAIAGGNHAVVIDGQILEWSISLAPIADSTADPFGSAAPADSDRPYYIYLAGGRNSPQSQSQGRAPVVMIDSLVAPDVRTGRPSSAITTPRGSTQSAVYCGIGFTKKGTTTRRLCQHVGDRVWSKEDVFEFISSGPPAGGVNVTLAGAPPISTEAVVRLIVDITFAAALGADEDDLSFGFPGSAGFDLSQETFLSPGAVGARQLWRPPMTLPIKAGGPHFHLFSGASITDVAINSLAFNMLVRRFA